MYIKFVKEFNKHLDDWLGVHKYLRIELLPAYF